MWFIWERSQGNADFQPAMTVPPWQSAETNC
jgi:hypothetical protein